MADNGEKLLVAAMGAFGAIGLLAVGLSSFSGSPEPPRPSGTDAAPERPVLHTVTAQSSGADWLESMRPHCNAVDLDTWMGWRPIPETADGQMYGAACLALAGRVDGARDAIKALPEDRRAEAAGVVFEVGHPAADAGDEVAAGPLMELVVEFWPNHYMALYHAGAARFESGDAEGAKPYLERFLQEYALEDGWRENAVAMLEDASGASR